MSTSKERRIDLERPLQVESEPAPEQVLVVLLDDAMLGFGKVLVELDVRVVDDDPVDRGEPFRDVLPLLAVGPRPVEELVRVQPNQVEVVVALPASPQHVVLVEARCREIGPHRRRVVGGLDEDVRARGHSHTQIFGRRQPAVFLSEHVQVRGRIQRRGGDDDRRQGQAGAPETRTIDEIDAEHGGRDRQRGRERHRVPDEGRDRAPGE